LGPPPPGLWRCQWLDISSNGVRLTSLLVGGLSVSVGSVAALYSMSACRLAQKLPGKRTIISESLETRMPFRLTT
jgi:hypothetical protein